MSSKGGLLMLALSTPTLAQAEGVEGEERRLIVGVPEESTGLPAEELAAALRAQLAELGVEVVLSSQPLDGADVAAREEGEQKTLALVWLGREEEVVAVYFFESAGAALRQRRLVLGGTDAASLEEVALVVRSAVSALLERLEDHEAPEPSSEQNPALVKHADEEPIQDPKAGAPDERAPFWLGLGWVGQQPSADLPFSHGAHLEFGYRPTKGNFGLGLAYQFLPSQTASDNQVAVTVSRHPLEALLTWQTDDWQQALFLGAEAGVMLDVSRRVTQVLVSELSAEPDATRTSFALSARALFGVRLGERIALKGLVGADVLAGRVVVEREDGQALLTPHRIRPRLSALLLWNFP